MSDLTVESRGSTRDLLALFEHVPGSMALLDSAGRVVAVNGAWRRFGLEQGARHDVASGVGLDYLSTCRTSTDPAALTAYDGIRDVLGGRSEEFTYVYSCHSSTRLRWFRMVVRRCGRGATVHHEDVTQAHLFQARLRVHVHFAKAGSARLPMLTACRELATILCEELEWDFAAIWTLDVASWRLRCCDAFARPGQQLGEFERATRQALLGSGTGAPGRAWRTAKVQWSTDLDVELTRAAEPQVRKLMPLASLRSGFKSQLAFPLKCGDDVLAIVELFSRVRRDADWALMEQLEVAGVQLAMGELAERARECARIAEREADEARARLQSVLDCAPAWVLVVDRNGQIEFVNRVGADERRDEVIGASWRRYVPEPQQARVELALAQTLRFGSPQHFEMAIKPPKGEVRWLMNYMGPLRSGEAITGAVVVVQDCTAAKLAQSELAEAQRLAAVGTLAAGVAHEINTPVQFVSDSIQFLRDAVGDAGVMLERYRAVVLAAERGADGQALADLCQVARQAEQAADVEYLREHVPRAFERAIEGLERVATIVRSMKEFAHPASRDMAGVDLNRAVHATLTVARNEYKYVADLETCFGDLPPVLCHVNEINQVVLNIVINAAHAIEEVVRGTDAKGRITVTTSTDGVLATIAIRDTGRGIPAEIRERIFEPFFTTKEVGRGTGQGLALARTSIHDHHGGEISFESDCGVGTTFYVRIPIAGTTPEVRP
jgi:PAS domain S-box-containing protein